MTNILYLKKRVFANNAIFSKIMSQSKDLFWLIQAPNISKHISRNGEATIKASRKQIMTNIFLFWSKKAIFAPPKWWHHEKRYSSKSVYGYQCFGV